MSVCNILTYDDTILDISLNYIALILTFMPFCQLYYYISNDYKHIYSSGVIVTVGLFLFQVSSFSFLYLHIYYIYIIYIFDIS